MVIVETSIFTQRIQALMSDDEYRQLQISLVRNPDTGPLIQGTGGLRKMRWKLSGRGKSGGIRVIYYWLRSDQQIYMLYAYAKGEQEDLTPDQQRLLKQIVERWPDG